MTIRTFRNNLMIGLLHLPVINNLYWKLNFGETIDVKWPKTIENSNDPNDLWRPWLEENVGIQHWDWAWRLSRNRSLYIQIKFRNKIYASQFILMFGTE